MLDVNTLGGREVVAITGAGIAVVDATTVAVVVVVAAAMVAGTM